MRNRRRQALTPEQRLAQAEMRARQYKGRRGTADRLNRERARFASRLNNFGSVTVTTLHFPVTDPNTTDYTQGVWSAA
jgi:hypothetical protein